MSSPAAPLRGLFGEHEEDELLPASDKLTSIMGGLRTWTAEERSKYCDELPEAPLFVPRAPAPSSAFASGAASAASVPAGYSQNEIAQAVINSAYDEFDTPPALARESKQKGNDAFARGADWFPNAIKHYNEAVAHAEKALAAGAAGGGGGQRALRREMRQLQSTCLSNLAAIYLARGKHITVIACCERALHLWPDNVKAAFRAAKSCIAVGRASAALEFCEVGRTAQPAVGAGPDAALAAAAAITVATPIAPALTSAVAPAAATKAVADPFAALVNEATALLARQERIAAATRAEQAAKAASLEAVREGCVERNVQVGPPLYAGGMRRTLSQPYVDGDGCMHWPVLLLYPQYGTSDFLEDVAESALLGEVLAHVFPRGAPRSSWDERGEYVEGNLDVFFKSNPCKPLPSPADWWTRAAEDEGASETWLTSRMVLVPPAAPLLFSLVQPSYVVADIPFFYVVARSSECHAEMKRKAGGAFQTLRVPKAALPQD